MASNIDPTFPPDGVPVQKQGMRDNLRFAKEEIEALQDGLGKARQPGVKEEAGTSITVDAAYLGEAGRVLILTDGNETVTVTLAADVPVGRSVELIQRGAGVPIAVAGDGASLTIPAGAAASPAVQHGSVVLHKITTTAWIVRDRTGAAITGQGSAVEIGAVRWNARLVPSGHDPSNPGDPEEVRAFPGVMGAGANAVGGRGGQVLFVTNLNDSGAGSFRAAVTASGPRTVVFRVGGTISLQSPIVIREPYLTVAGQSAPGGGIQIDGRAFTSNMFRIETNDVIMRYLRIRKGWNANDPETLNGKVLACYRGAVDCVFDHLSLTWSGDGISVWPQPTGSRPVSRRLTYSNILYAESMRGGEHHRLAFLTGSEQAISDQFVDVDIIRCLLLNFSHRVPLLKNKRARMVNNLIYNWSRYATHLGGGIHADLIGNRYKTGPLYLTGVGNYEYEIGSFPGGGSTTSAGDPSIYLSGNIGPHNADPAADNWLMIREISSENGSEVGPLSTQYRRNEPLAPVGAAIRLLPVSDLDDELLPTVGCSHRLDCDGNWVNVRDECDERLVNHYLDGTGQLVAHEDEVGGFPTIAGGRPCQDSNDDGVPDRWSVANGIDPNEPGSGLALAPNNYTYLENYLNGVV